MMITLNNTQQESAVLALLHAQSGNFCKALSKPQNCRQHKRQSNYYLTCLSEATLTCLHLHICSRWCKLAGVTTDNVTTTCQLLPVLNLQPVIRE